MNGGQRTELRVALVNMPFGAVERPAIGLTQLAAVCRERFGAKVQVDLHYLNNDFARNLGADVYGDLASGPYYTTGLGDWLFRHIAFPDEPDNLDSYLRRYFPSPRFHGSIASDGNSFRNWIVRCQEAFERLLTSGIDERGLDHYDIVGLTSAFAQTGACLALARLLKKRRSELVTVMGGANCEGAMGAAIARNAKQLDFVFSGTALSSFPEFLERYQNGEPAQGRIISGPERPISKPVPDLDYDSYLEAFDREIRGLGLEPCLLFETSRGCWWGEISQCTFCGLNGMTMAYRQMEADQAVHTVRQLFSYRPRCTSLMSVDNIMPRGFVRDVVPRLHTPPDTTIFYEVKANLTRADLTTLGSAGFREIQPGIESLSTEHLRLMRKGTTSFRNIQLLANCGELGISVLWNLLVGFPRETERPYKLYETALPRLFHLQPPSGIYPLRFDRFSPYFEEAEEYDLKLAPADFYRFIYPYSEESLADQAYYFADTSPKAEYRTHLVRWLPCLRKIISAWQAAWQADSRPELTAHEDADDIWITDTRAGARSYMLSDAEAVVLRACKSPVSVAALRKAATESGGPCGDQVLDQLRRSGLIFEDSDHAMSLVKLPGSSPAEEVCQD
jgi:ribosomal peptide maturation radical SAM protein 1